MYSPIGERVTGGCKVGDPEDENGYILRYDKYMVYSNGNYTYERKCDSGLHSWITKEQCEKEFNSVEQSGCSSMFWNNICI